MSFMNNCSITFITRLLRVKTFVYQPMDPGSNPSQGKFFFFQINTKLSRCIYASLACKGLKLNPKEKLYFISLY